MNKRLYRIGIGVSLFVLILLLVFISGAVFSCNKSGGVISDTFDCVDIDTLPYCQFQNNIYSSTPMFNLTGLKKND